MQKVIRREKEPITPFLERARSLYEKGGISTVLVAGSSGAFFHIADTIIQMDNYCPVDITSSTKELCKSYPLTESHIPPFHMPQSHRVMTKAAPSKTKSRNYFGKEMASVPERLKIKVHGKDGFSLGKQEIDLRYIEQIADGEQTASLALLLKYACEHLIDGKRTLGEIVELLNRKLEEKGFDAFRENGYVSGGYALPRIQEIYSCFNRYRRV